MIALLKKMSIKEKILYALLCLSIILLFCLSKNHSGDGAARLEQLKSVLFLDKPNYNKYSLIGTLFSTPLAYIDHLMGLDDISIDAYNTILFFIFCIVFFNITKEYLSLKQRLSFLLLLIFSSMMRANIRTYYGETFSALTVFLSMILFQKSSHKNQIWAIILLSLGTANTPAFIVPTGLYLIFLSFTKKNIKYCFYICFPILLILIENKIKFGSFLSTPYQSSVEQAPIKQLQLPYNGVSNFNYPFFLGLLGILFSFGRGLIFFTPALFIKPNITNNNYIKHIYQGGIIFIIGLILIYAKWFSWHGGICWGPRFFLLATLITSLILVINLDKNIINTNSLRQNIILCIIVLLSFYIGLINEIVPFQSINNLPPPVVGNTPLENEWLLFYSPEYSDLYAPFVFNMFTVTPNTILYTLLWLITLCILCYPLFKKTYSQFSLRSIFT